MHSSCRAKLQMGSCFCPQPCIVMLQWWLVTTAHTTPCHGFGKLSPIGTWDANSWCCGPVLVCLGSAGTWGVRGGNLLSHSNAVGCTGTAELLHRKGLLPPLPGSSAVTGFRDGAVPVPHAVPACPAFLAERGQWTSAPRFSPSTQGRGAGPWWHTVNCALFGAGN